MRSAISVIRGRSPNASITNSTAPRGSPSGRASTASAVPSGVLTSSSVAAMGLSVANRWRRHPKGVMAGARTRRETPDNDERSLMTAAAATAPSAATVDERAAEGRARRAEAPRSRHGEWAPESDRPDPVALLEEQGDSRVAELLPIRYGRMAVSPFAYYRGAAYAMAWDLAKTPTSGIGVQLCGDAHLSNFGGFASPERKLIFDLNDFDETLPGPFEWDVKRLAASIDVAARARSFSGKDRRRAVRGSVEEYRTAMRTFAEMDPLDVWYAHLGADDIRARFGDDVGRSGVKRFDKLVAKGKGKDSSRAFAKLAHAVDGGARILADPPLIAPIEDLVSRTAAKKFEKAMIGLIESYVETLPLARREVIGRYTYAHCARKLVGVGSVGTRAWVILMLGPTRGSPVPPGQGGPAVGAGAVRRGERVRAPGPARRRGPAADAVRERHRVGLGERDEHRGRRRTRLLRPPALGLEDLGRHRHDGPTGHGRLRAAVRLDRWPARTPCSGEPAADRRLSRLGRVVRPRDHAVRRRPTPTRTSATTARSSGPSTTAASTPSGISQAAPP